MRFATITLALLMGVLWGSIAHASPQTPPCYPPTHTTNNTYISPELAVAHRLVPVWHAAADRADIVVYAADVPGHLVRSLMLTSDDQVWRLEPLWSARVSGLACGGWHGVRKAFDRAHPGLGAYLKPPSQGDVPIDWAPLGMESVLGMGAVLGKPGVIAPGALPRVDVHARVKWEELLNAFAGWSGRAVVRNKPLWFLIPPSVNVPAFPLALTSPEFRLFAAPGVMVSDLLAVMRHTGSSGWSSPDCALSAQVEHMLHLPERISERSALQAISVATGARLELSAPAPTAGCAALEASTQPVPGEALARIEQMSLLAVAERVNLSANQAAAVLGLPGGSRRLVLAGDRVAGHEVKSVEWNWTNARAPSPEVTLQGPCGALRTISAYGAPWYTLRATQERIPEPWRLAATLTRPRMLSMMCGTLSPGEFRFMRERLAIIEAGDGTFHTLMEHPRLCVETHGACPPQFRIEDGALLWTTRPLTSNGRLDDAPPTHFQEKIWLVAPRWP